MTQVCDRPQADASGPLPFATGSQYDSHHIMRYNPNHKQSTRARVVREAAKAIRAKGTERVGVAEVMAAAGLTHGGFYAHFPSREALIESAIGQMFEDGAASMARSLEGKAPGEGLSAYIDNYLSAIHRDTRTAGCALPFLSADGPRLTGEARACYARGAERVAARLSDQFTALGFKDPDALASSVLAELVGALALARAEPDPAASDLILARSRAALKSRLGLESA